MRWKGCRRLLTKGCPGLGSLVFYARLSMKDISLQWIFLAYLVGCCYFAPVASRVSPRRASYFFLRRQKKVTKKKRATSVPLRGALRYSQRSGHLQTRFAQTMQVPSSERCSVAQHGLMAGGYHTARPLREPRPNGSFTALTSRSAGVDSFLYPHFSQGTARRATTTDPLIPTTSPLPPHPSLLPPPSSLLTPPSSLLTPHSSLQPGGICKVPLPAANRAIHSGNAALRHRRRHRAIGP